MYTHSQDSTETYGEECIYGDCCQVPKEKLSIYLYKVVIFCEKPEFGSTIVSEGNNFC